MGALGLRRQMRAAIAVTTLREKPGLTTPENFKRQVSGPGQKRISGIASVSMGWLEVQGL